MTTSTPPSDTDDEHTTGGADRRRWVPIVIALVVVAAIVAVVLLVVGGDDDDDGGDDATEDPSGPPSLPESVGEEVDAEGQELLDLLEAGRDLEHHAVYTATGDPATLGGGLTIEVWRLDGQVRTDTRQVTDETTVESAGFLLDDSIVVCNRADEGEWTCSRQEDPPEEAADTFFGSYVQQLQGQDVTATEEEIDGRAARCFAVTGEEGEVSFCITPDGLPVRLRGQGTELLLTEYSDDVSPDVFTPPAEPVSADG